MWIVVGIKRQDSADYLEGRALREELSFAFQLEPRVRLEPFLFEDAVLLTQVEKRSGGDAHGERSDNFRHVAIKTCRLEGFWSTRMSV